MPRLKKKETAKLHLKLGSVNRTQINANKKYQYSLGPGFALGENGEKYRRWVKKEICERSEPSGSLGSRKGGGAWRHACDAAVP